MTRGGWSAFIDATLITAHSEEEPAAENCWRWCWPMAAKCASDLGAGREQDALFGKVASDATAFRTVHRIASDPVLVDALRTAHANARDRF